jgi:CcmD family protein
MADRLRADGKIYVVVAVVLVVLLGLLTYLIRLDGRISKVEKELKS